MLVPEYLETTPCLFHSRHPGFQKNAPQFLVFHPSHPDCLERKEKIVFIYIYKKVFFSHTGPGFFGWDFLFRFGIIKEQEVLDLRPCKLYCPTFKQLQMSPPRYSQYHEGINGLPLSLFFTNKDHNYLKAKTGHLHSLEIPLQQKQTNKAEQKIQQNPLDTSPHSQSIKSHCCSSSTSQVNAGNYSKA